MPCLICYTCKYYYKFKKAVLAKKCCGCGEKLKWAENINTELFYREKVRNKTINLKLFTISLFNLIITGIFMTGILLALLCISSLGIDYKLLISVVLIIFLVFRYILSEINTNNKYLTFLVDKAIYLIIPFLIIFIGTVVYNATIYS